MRLYDQITSQRPAVEETLTNPQAATWVVNAACTLTKNDGLHVYSSETNYFRYCEGFTNDYINFAFQVQMQVLSGDAGGLVFRVDDSSGSLYAFVVSPTGLYRVWILKPGTDHAEDLTMGTTQAVYPESVQADTLAVIAQGAIFDFYINRQFVTQVQDATLQRGYLGVLASDETQATEVVYTNEQIWDVG